MRLYRKKTHIRNYQLNLFDWVRERELYGSNRAARRIAQRFGLSLHHAATIARLVELGSEVDR